MIQVMAAEYQTLLKCGPKLVEAIAPSVLTIAEDLAATNVVPSSVIAEIKLPALADESKASKLIDVVKMKVQSHPKLFKDFIKCLEKHLRLSDLMNKVWTTYEKNGGVRVHKTGDSSGATDDAIKEAGRRIARGAVSNAVQRRKKDQKKESSFLQTLAVIAIFIAVFGGLFSGWTWGKHNEMKDTVKGCTEIKGSRDVGRILEKVGLSYEKTCSDMGMSDNTCSKLFGGDRKGLEYNTIAVEYLEQNPKACWEDIIQILCQNFKHMRLARQAATKFNVRNYEQYC